MTVPNLYTKQFSQRQICQIMDFSESTVKSWGRKGFRLVGQGGAGQIETKRGQPNSLTGYNALELMLTIHLFRQGIDPLKAHKAAVSFSHVRMGSSYRWGNKQEKYDRDPGQLFQQQGTGTLLVIALGNAPLPHVIVPYTAVEKGISNYTMLSYYLGITSQDHAGIAIFFIDSHVRDWRQKLGLPLYPHDEIHELRQEDE